MKKVLHKGTLQDVSARLSKQGQIVLYRTGDNLCVQNLDLPKDLSFDLSRLKSDNELLIRIAEFKDGEFLMIRDVNGISEKKRVIKYEGE